MRNKIKFLGIILIILITTIMLGNNNYYTKIGEHDIQLNEYLLSDELYSELLENEHLFEIYSFSQQSLQLQTKVFRVLIQMKVSFDESYNFYSQDNVIILYLDYFMQEELLQQDIRDKVIYFENLKFIGVTEVTVISGWPEKRPVFTFTKDTDFKILYEKNR